MLTLVAQEIVRNVGKHHTSICGSVKTTMPEASNSEESFGESSGTALHAMINGMYTKSEL